MIENHPVATCDACGHTVVANRDCVFETGYMMTIRDLAEGTDFEAFACRETHFGKAAKAGLTRLYAKERAEYLGKAAATLADHSDDHSDEGGGQPAAVALTRDDFGLAQAR